MSVSDEALARAERYIPGGTGTFSKSSIHWPGLPQFAARGKGCRLWDVDGNEYIDLVMGLTAVILGYAYDEVDEAVIRQVRDGPIFTLPTQLEADVAEHICSMVSNAEMVRFGKNGSDATSGAVRLARYITRRDHVACCGYHGWQSWSIGVTGRNGGVPSRVSELTHPFEYNNIESLQAIFERYPNQVACVIMEPVNKDEPKDSFLNRVRDLCHRNGTLFILDEVITGFRLAKGGAQEYYKIDADLVCLGKAIANGYPLSAIAGKAEYMRHMTDIHYSFTYSGDCIALAAAKATLGIIEREDVPERLNQHGSWLIQQFQLSLKKYDLADHVTISGASAWPHIQFIDPKMRQLFRQAMAHHGALILDTLNLCYDLTCESWAVKQALGEAVDKSFGFVAAALDQGVDDYLKWPVPTGIFKIR